MTRSWKVYVCGPDSAESYPICYATFYEHPVDANNYAQELATRYSKECHLFVIDYEGTLSFTIRGNHVCSDHCIHNQGRKRK